MTFAFDIDGTVIHHPGRPDYLSPVSLAEAEPDLEACSRVRAIILAGNPVHFITGRTHKVRAITLNQLRAYIHPHIAENHLTTQETFLGYAQMAEYKAKALKDCGAFGYVGDHVADQEAAKQAGVPFLYAHEFRAGVAWA